MKPHPLVICTLFYGAVLPSALPVQDSAGSAKSSTAEPDRTTVSFDFGAAARVRQLSGKVTLADAVNLALRQNPDVVRALREIERARGRVLEVRAQALPHLSLNASYDEVDPKLPASGSSVAR